MKTNSEDGPWEEENQICTNEIDPPCGGAKTLLGQQQQKADASHALTVKIINCLESYRLHLGLLYPRVRYRQQKPTTRTNVTRECNNIPQAIIHCNIMSLEPSSTVLHGAVVVVW